LISQTTDGGVLKPSEFAGVVLCLRCRRDFYSVDRRLNRICPKCDKTSERFGILADRASTVDNNEDDRSGPQLKK
jgi:Zn finger protein HypA/HybF involved in hydrogenase expression